MAAASSTKTLLSRLLRLGLGVLVVVLTMPILASLLFHVNALPLPNRSLLLSDSSAGATNVTYVVGFEIGTAAPLGSILIQLCSNDPFPETPCTPITGLDVTSAVFANQTGEMGFLIDSTTPNTILLTRTPAVAATVAVSYTFTGITNPSNTGSYYARYLTYATDDGTGPVTDSSGLAWTINNPFVVTSEVPPNLEFCVAVTIPALNCSAATGSTVSFGDFSPGSTSSGTSQMLVYTNAGYGFSVSLYGATMTSGSYTIPALTTQSFAAPGNSQFGMNLRDNSSPNVGSNPVGPGTAVIDANYNSPNLFRFVSGDTVVSSPGTSDFRKFTASYITNVSSSQRPGQYNTTISYICLANF